MLRDFFHTGLQVSRSQVKALIGGLGPGNIYYVDYRKGQDGASGLSWGRALRTYGEAVSRVTSNNNDVILIDGDSEIVETAMVTLSKNRVHTIGMNGPPGHYGQGAKINIGVTTDTDDIACIKNTGIRNTFSAVKVMSDNTLTEARYSFAEGGEFTRFFNTEFFKSTHLDDTAAAEFLHNGDSAMFYRSTFGSTANIIADSKIRANVLVTATLSGKKCRDTLFDDCLFFSKAGGNEHVAIYGANATDVERMFAIKNSIFFNNPLSAATPDAAIAFGAAQTEGAVFVDSRCAVVDFAVLATTGQGIYTLAGSSPTYATAGLSVAS